MAKKNKQSTSILDFAKNYKYNGAKEHPVFVAPKLDSAAKKIDILSPDSKRKVRRGLDILRKQYPDNINLPTDTGNWNDSDFGKAGYSLNLYPDDTPNNMELTGNDAFAEYGLPPGFGVQKNYNTDKSVSNARNPVSSAVLGGYVRTQVIQPHDLSLKKDASDNYILQTDGQDAGKNVSEALLNSINTSFGRQGKFDKTKSGFYNEDGSMDEQKVLGALASLLLTKEGSRYVKTSKQMLSNVLKTYNPAKGTYDNPTMFKASKGYIKSIYKKIKKARGK